MEQEIQAEKERNFVSSVGIDFSSFPFIYSKSIATSTICLAGKIINRDNNYY